VVQQPRRRNGESSINALAATATVPPNLGLEDRMGTRASVANQIGSSICREEVHYLGFCLEQEWVVNGEFALRHSGAKFGQQVKSYGVRGT
jgi:hypothetical protein